VEVAGRTPRIAGVLRRGTTVLFVVFGAPYLVRVAVACMCSPHGSPEEVLGESSVVFVGTVTSTRSTGCSHTRSSIVVDEAFKGTQRGSTITVRGWTNWDCELTLSENETYVLFLGGDDTTVSACTPSVRMSPNYTFEYCEWVWDTSEGYPADQRCETIALSGEEVVERLRAAA
jgi:hypothetical protein